MHQLYFVAVPVDEASNPDEAMSEATSVLDSENFASNDNGYFGSAKADYYTIGGRWSSFLADRHEWVQKANKEIEELLEANKWKGEVMNIRGASYGDKKATKKQAELREKAEMIWGKNRPPEYPKVRWDRWADEDGNMSFSPTGIDDCAELVSQELIDYIVKCQKNWGDDYLEFFITDERDEVTTKYIEENAEKFIGKYYFVVIDYHI